MDTNQKLLTLYVLNVSDYLMTLKAVNLGAIELNPILSLTRVYDPVKFTVAKIGVAGTAILSMALIQPYLTNTYAKIGEALINALLILYAIINAMNVMQLVLYHLGVFG